MEKKETDENLDDTKVKLVIFTLMNELFAFYGDDVREILPFSQITYVPGTPSFIPGIINVRGDIESVLDIHQFMGLPGIKIDSNSRVVIAEKNDIRSGILMDSVNDVVDISQKEIQPPLATLHRNIKEFVLGETTYRDQLIILLDIGKIFEKMVS